MASTELSKPNSREIAEIKSGMAAFFKEKRLARGFKWRDRRGRHHPIQNMETRHLFYVVRMIWNHTVPMKLQPYRKYIFNDFYTREYMINSIKHMLPELCERDDIKEDWALDLRAMLTYLRMYQLEKTETR